MQTPAALKTAPRFTHTYYTVLTALGTRYFFSRGQNDTADVLFDHYGPKRPALAAKLLASLAKEGHTVVEMDPKVWPTGIRRVSYSGRLAYWEVNTDDPQGGVGVGA